MEWKMFLIGMTGLLGLYLMGTVLFHPLRFLIRLAAWSMLGAFLLVALNALFGFFGLHIAINPWTILTAGILQLPGIVLLVVLNYFLIC